ncbi:potassium-transporting ATPase subunit KdpB, partial [uncultured Microbacterium sp.]|uniref:potassium-transporting ATPase subunit KdpB n=1 Tax=uncultured Microbacterium sp. TaxID=191216 RepID=UPI0025FB2000
MTTAHLSNPEPVEGLRPVDAPDASGTPPRPPRAFGGAQLLRALPGALRRLNPATLVRNPVILLVWAGAALTTVLALAEPFIGTDGQDLPAGFTASIAVWLWLTVLFANLAESVAEGRGKAQAATLRKTRTSTLARRVIGYEKGSDPAAERARTEEVSSSDLRRDDVVIVVAGEAIPGDGDIIAGIATVDESAITGESAPVVRESGGDRSAVTGGTRVLSDRIVVRITSKPGETFVDRMIALVEGADRQRTPNEIALNILLASLSIVFVVVVLALNPIASYSHSAVGLAVLVALLVCLIPTTIGALLSAIGIAGMDRLVQRNVLAMSGRAVEAAGDVTTLLLDKTGTITYGNRRATDVLPVAGVEVEELLRAAALASLADPTPEGASIVELATVRGLTVSSPRDAESVPFTAQTRMSGVDLADGSRIRKGAGSAIRAWLESEGALTTHEAEAAADEAARLAEGIAASGGTPLVVAVAGGTSAAADGVSSRSARSTTPENPHQGSLSEDAAGARDETHPAPARTRILGVVHLKDVVKEGLAERFTELRSMGIRTVMITGDNPLTAKAIAAEAGV